METEVKIADLKTHLSQYLRSVRLGHQIIVKDRETPIARVVPYEEPRSRLVTRKPTRSIQEVERMLRRRPKKNIRLKPGALERAYRETRMDWFDKWMASRRTSTRR